MKKSKIIYLIGYPGVGKLTIANEISNCTDFVTIDNHSINNIFFKVDFTDEEGDIPDFVWDSIDKTWEILFETYKQNKKEMNLIFTNALFQEKEFSHNLFNRINKFANSINAELYPVVINCDWDEHKTRVSTDDRKNNFKIVSQDFTQLIINENSILIPDHKNTLVINNTHLSPKDVAINIIKKTT